MMVDPRVAVDTAADKEQGKPMVTSQRTWRTVELWTPLSVVPFPVRRQSSLAATKLVASTTPLQQRSVEQQQSL